MTSETNPYENSSVTKRVAAAMSEISRIPKNGRNQHARYDYATADDVFATIRPILAKHELSVKHDARKPEMIRVPGAKEGKDVLFVPIRVWFDGEWPPAEYTHIPLSFPTPQGMQAVITYAVKYWLRARLLLDTGEEDADAQSTDGPATEPAPTRLEVPSKASPIQCDADGKIELRGGGDIMQHTSNTDILRAVYSAAINEIEANNPGFVRTNLSIIQALPQSGREAIAKRLTDHEVVQALLVEKER